MGEVVGALELTRAHLTATTKTRHVIVAIPSRHLLDPRPRLLRIGTELHGDLVDPFEYAWAPVTSLGRTTAGRIRRT
jgi:hypothetical protein